MEDKENIAADLDLAVEDIQNKLDIQFRDAMLEVIELNSVIFECPCKKSKSQVFVNLAEGAENTFTCDKCNKTYRINISMTPILVGDIGSFDDANVLRLLAKKHKEYKDYGEEDNITQRVDERY